MESRLPHWTHRGSRSAQQEIGDMRRCPYKRGERWYYSHNSGLQAQSVMYSQKTLDEEATVLLDPNTFSSDGTVGTRTPSLGCHCDFRAI